MTTQKRKYISPNTTSARDCIKIVARRITTEGNVNPEYFELTIHSVYQLCNEIDRLRKEIRKLKGAK